LKASARLYSLSPLRWALMCSQNATRRNAR
jgi:hypothetical protein